MRQSSLVVRQNKSVYSKTDKIEWRSKNIQVAKTIWECTVIQAVKSWMYLEEEEEVEMMQKYE